METLNHSEVNIDIPQITERAMLVELSIGVYKFKKTDKTLSDEVASNKKAADGVVEAKKNLLTKCKPLEKIKKLEGQARNWHYKHTIPWSDSGLRLVTIQQYLPYVEQLNGFKDEFYKLKRELLNLYPDLINKQSFASGDLFNRDDYATVEQLEDKFHFGVNYFPLPQSGDFRVDVPNEIREQLQSNYDTMFKKTLEGAMSDLWKRLHDKLLHIKESLVVAGDGKKKVFRDTMLINARELCELLTNMNVTNDPELEQRRKELESAISGLTVDELRDSVLVREDVTAKVDSILDKMKF